MKNVVYVTGNAHKAKYFSQLVGTNVAHKKVAVPEIQSLDAVEVVSAKAWAAYQQLGQPVIVEDTSLVIYAMGRLPGTFIKWFLDELGPEKLCRLADTDPDRRATASAIFAYYDGVSLRTFEGSSDGSIATQPRGTSGFGWNVVFVPDGSQQTLGEMNATDFTAEYLKIKHFDKIKSFLETLAG